MSKPPKLASEQGPNAPTAYEFMVTHATFALLRKSDNDE